MGREYVIIFAFFLSVGHTILGRRFSRQQFGKEESRG